MQTVARKRLVMLREYSSSAELEGIDERTHLEIELALEEEAWADDDNSFAVDSPYFKAGGGFNSGTENGGDQSASFDRDGRAHRSTRSESKRDKRRREDEDAARIANEDSFISDSFWRREKSVAKIFLWVILCAIYLGISQNFEYSSVESDFFDAAPLSQSAGARQLYARRIHYYLQRFAARNVSLGSYDVPIRYNDILYVADKLETLQHAMVYGNPGLNLNPYVDDHQDRVLFENACYHEDTANDIPGCVEFGNGMMTAGLHSVIMQYITITRRLTSIYNSSSLIYSLPADQLLSTTDMILLATLDNSYMFSAMNESIHHHNNHAQDVLNDITPVRVSLLSVFLVCTALVFVFDWSPQVHRLDTEIRNTRSMLLLIPVSVVEQLPQVQRFISELMSGF